jgi:hypothetical protein
MSGSAGYAAMRRWTPRPYEIVALSDHGQTQGATFCQRHGYGLGQLVERSLVHGDVTALPGGDEQQAMVKLAAREAGAPAPTARDKRDVSEREVVVLGSGNLGLVYLMHDAARVTREDILVRHPALLRTLQAHPHLGWLLVRSDADGPVVLGPHGSRRLRDDVVVGVDPLAGFGPHAADHLRRTDGFAHCADIVVGSFYDPVAQEGCAFEELISFHGGLGGPQTRPFLLYPAGRLADPPASMIGAAAVHDVLAGWRRDLQGQAGGASGADVPDRRVEVLH